MSHRTLLGPFYWNLKYRHSGGRHRSLRTYHSSPWNANYCELLKYSLSAFSLSKKLWKYLGHKLKKQNQVPFSLHILLWQQRQTTT
jgi:hypothetical protein